MLAPLVAAVESSEDRNSKRHKAVTDLELFKKGIRFWLKGWRTPYRKPFDTHALHISYSLPQGLDLITKRSKAKQRSIGKNNKGLTFSKKYLSKSPNPTPDPRSRVRGNTPRAHTGSYFSDFLTVRTRSDPRRPCESLPRALATEQDTFKFTPDGTHQSSGTVILLHEEKSNSAEIESKLEG